MVSVLLARLRSAISVCESFSIFLFGQIVFWKVWFFFSEARMFLCVRLYMGCVSRDFGLSSGASSDQA